MKLIDEDLSRLGYLAEAVVDRPEHAAELTAGLISGVSVEGPIVRPGDHAAEGTGNSSEFAKAAQELAKTVRKAHLEKRSTPRELIKVAKSLGEQPQGSKKLAAQALMWAAQNRLWSEQA